MDVEKVLDSIVSQYRDIMQENLVGVYLHGSIAMGCFNPHSSDIDFLVVVKKDVTVLEKRKLVNVLLQLSKEGPHKDFEMSVILEEEANNIKYPTPYILHFSNAHKNNYLADPNFICGNYVDEDLAAHITIINYRGICLFGKPINQVFQTVPTEYYIQSIMGDIKFAKKDIVDMPVYLTLNLCRVLYFLQEGVVCSKKEGGEWGTAKLPMEYRNIVDNALLVYSGEANNVNWDQKRLCDFADYMQEQIHIAKTS